MSDKILQILMQLFAIIARIDEYPLSEDDHLEKKESVTSSKGKKIIRLFLTQEIGVDLTEKYLLLFDDYLKKLHKTSKKRGLQKKTSVNSVKILRICTEINRELIQIQKIIILVRLVEFIFTNEEVTQQEKEFVSTVAELFHISKKEYQDIFDFVSLQDEKDFDIENVLYAHSQKQNHWKKAKQIEVTGLNGIIRILRVESVNTYFFGYSGEDQIVLNGQIVPSKRQHIFHTGSSLKTPKSSPIYYSNIVGFFLSDTLTEKILFSAEAITYRFNKNKIAIHPLSFNENNGNLIGIMGGSGTGKSTLLNLLNGNLKPSSGKVTINGIDIHKNKKEVEGVMGYVSQDDLLIEELTISENLYFNVELCFKNLSKFEKNKKTIEVLKAIGLYEDRNLQVGTPLDKKISGGQRKRLNIALELIREPAILFIDEPTSGLSSRDSENIMNLLKELTLKGSLIYTVIHQPSSDIFKMFDKLLLIDQGGYPVFYGDPIDSLVYFKTEINHANCEERTCPVCGNVNAEQILDVIEAKVIDEFGNPTHKRRISPEEWNKRFLKKRKQFEYKKVNTKLNIPTRTPSKIKQLLVFFKRDTFTKLSNHQYLIINSLQAPILAILLALFVKYFSNSNHSVYTYHGNENIPQFLFISVITALFLGLTLSAEEIIKDKKILKRESFLNLSRGSYLFSKTLLLFLISAFQTTLFVLIANSILEIQDMWFSYWLVLFSTACFGNLLGLNISAAFNSVKVIYILIPLMIIPQLLFSGVIVKFDKLHPWFAKEQSVPWIGNIMASRWAYEGLAVTQYTENEYEKPFYIVNQKISETSWKKDYWLSELINQYNIYNNYYNDSTQKEEAEKARKILITEISKEENLYNPDLNFTCVDCLEALKKQNWNAKISDNMSAFLDALKRIYIHEINTFRKEKSVKAHALGEEKIKDNKINYFNQSLANHVTNRDEINKLIIVNQQIIQKSDPIYKIENNDFFSYHFYAPQKKIFFQKLPTLYANILIIWGMSFILFLTLYLNIFKRGIQKIEKFTIPYKKEE